MHPRASFIAIGDVYYATYRAPGSRDEEILEIDGKKIRFVSATDAVKAAIRHLGLITERAKTDLAPTVPYSDHIAVLEWKKEKAAEVMESRSAFVLRNTKVVVKKSRIPKKMRRG